MKQEQELERIKQMLDTLFWILASSVVTNFVCFMCLFLTRK